MPDGDQQSGEVGSGGVSVCVRLKMGVRVALTAKVTFEQSPCVAAASAYLRLE